ncbi:MAG: 30S ribosomal protein S5 [Alphaproteobacteria bacterium]|nr:30S ribosomal protein S5 [Alphaproteobacteria bacterium]MBN2780224.1 30S ribosomal protein S5 [Alphaproteobacteria bacterium]
MAKMAQNTKKDDGLFDRLVHINRVTKVVKGGKNMSFAAIVVIGDKNGHVGYGTGKAREVPQAVEKAKEQAKRTMVHVPMREGRTLHHDLIARFGAAKVVLRSAPSGTGIIAGGAIRAIFDVLGISDVVSKSIGSQNPHNMIKATFKAFEMMQSPKKVAMRRGKRVTDIVKNREEKTTTV